MDELANQIHVKPNFLKLWFQEPDLAHLCFFGPCVPFQYRLNGPGAWSGASQACRDAYVSAYGKLPVNSYDCID